MEVDGVVSRQSDRTLLRLHLVGGDHADGEVPLEQLGQIAERTQTLVLRIARGLSGREGAGRTPAPLRAATRLLLVALGAGSTTLDVAGPPLQAELDLGDDVPSNVTEQSLDVLAGALSAAAYPDAPVPAGLSTSAGDTLDALLADLSAYRRVDVTVKRARSIQHIMLVPPQARETLETKRTSPADLSGATTARVVEGILYAVDLHSGRFRVEDDLGNSISLRVPTELMEGVEGLLARRVRAAGTARVSRDGRLLDVVVTDLAGAPEISGLEPLPFWHNADLEAALRQRPPVRSIDDLEIADLTDEEADGFWAAIDGRRD